MARNRPRTTRASCVQPISDRISVIAKYVLDRRPRGGTAAASPIHSGMVGIEIRNSISRWMNVSMAPP